MAAVVTPVQTVEPEASAAREAASRRWLLRIGVALLAAVYLFTSGISAFTGIAVTDLDVFFMPSALYVLHGQPLLIYALRYETYPVANGPLGIMLLAAVGALAQHLGWLNDYTLRRMLIMVVFSIFPLLMSWEAVAAVDRVRGAPLRGIVRLLAFGLFATAPGIWHSMLLYGHVEQPLAIWLTLLAIRLAAEEHPNWAGLSMGLALLTRTSVLVPCLVLVLVLAGRRRFWSALAFLGITGVTAMLGILPFFLADRQDVVYSLLTFRGTLGIGGGSVWYLTFGTPLENIGIRYDSWIILGVAALITIVFLLLHRRLTVAHRDLYGLMALAGLCFPLLIKTTWPYYYFDLYIYMAIWWLGSAHGWNTVVRWLGLFLPAFVLICEGLADYGTSLQTDVAAERTESLAIAVMQVGFMIFFGAYLLIRREPQAPEALSVVVAPGSAAT